MLDQKIFEHIGRTTFVVVKDSNSPVYEVKPDVGDGRHRTLHRNIILPCNYLPVDTSDTPVCTKRRPRHRPPQRDFSMTTPVNESLSEEEDDNFLLMADHRLPKLSSGHRQNDIA